VAERVEHPAPRRVGERPEHAVEHGLLILNHVVKYQPADPAVSRCAPMTARRRHARREDLGLTRAEFAVLRRLDSPLKIQRFLNELKQNFEPGGDTCRPVREVLRTRSAHCIEGAMLAAAALWVHGEPPVVLDLRAVRDYDHVVALFRRRGRWGAISKTNGIGLRWRDPIYASLRELAMSYFHEYYNRRDHKTLREYSVPFDLRRVDPRRWAGGDGNVWHIAETLDRLRHFRLVDGHQLKWVARRDPFERKVGALLQYRPPRRRRPKRGNRTYIP
jgi:hypothetical protein